VALLTNINRKCCEDLINSFGGATVHNDSRVKRVLTSCGGSELLRSQILPYVDSSESHIELFHYIIVEEKGETAATIFAELVYEEATSCIRSTGSTLHFQQLIMEELFSGNSFDYVWLRGDILLYKAKLLKEITKAVSQNGEVVLRCLELYQGAFVRVSRRYTLITIDEGVPMNFEIYPLSSVHRAVFVNHDDLELYIKACSDAEQEASR